MDCKSKLLVTKSFIATCADTQLFLEESTQCLLNDDDDDVVMNRELERELTYLEMEEQPNSVQSDLDIDDESEELELPDEFIEYEANSLLEDDCVDLEESESLDKSETLTTFPVLTTGEKNTNKTQRFRCDICSKSYKLEINLKIHNMSESHAEIKAKRGIECPICKKILKSMKTLKGHQLTHTGLRPFKCELCGKAYKVNTSLNHHRKIHYIPGPYYCKICQCYFKKIKQMHLHKKEKHPRKTKQQNSILLAGMSF